MKKRPNHELFHDPEVVGALEQLYFAGIPHVVIAKFFKVSPTTISNVILECELPKRRLEKQMQTLQEVLPTLRKHLEAREKRRVPNSFEKILKALEGGPKKLKQVHHETRLCKNTFYQRVYQMSKEKLIVKYGSRQHTFLALPEHHAMYFHGFGDKRSLDEWTKVDIPDLWDGWQYDRFYFGELEKNNADRKTQSA